MGTKVGSLEIELAANIARLQTDFAAARAEVNKATSAMASSITNMQGSIERSIGAAMQSVKLLTGGLATMAAAKHVIEVASTFEQLEIRLNAVMGSARDGQQAFEWIKQFAVNTPYSVQQTTDAFMQLKNFGLDPMDGTLQKVADASAKYGKGADTAQRVTLALGQAWARGKLQGQDTLQMIDAGIPVYDLLSKATGKTAAEIQKMSEKGEMGRDVMRKLIDQMGVEGAGAAAAKMNSYAGAVSNMGDAFENAIDKLRKQGGFDFITQAVLRFTDVLPQMVAIAGEVFAALGDMAKVLWSVVTDVFSGINAILVSVFGSSGEGMTGMELFTNMLKVVQVAVIGFRTGFQLAFAFIKMLLAETIAQMMTFADVVGRALRFDFSGAKEAWQNGMANSRAIVQQGMDDMVAIAEKGRADIDKAVLGDGGAAKVGDHKQVDTPAASASGGGDKMAKWKAELEARKETEGQYFKTSLADDEAFWQAKLALVASGSKEAASIRHELYIIHQKIAQQQFAAEMETLKDTYAAARAGSDERIALATQTAQRVGETYGWESKEYLAAIKEVRKAAEEWDKEQQKLDVLKVERMRDHGIAQIGMAQDHLALMKSLGQISDQEEIAALQQLENQKYQIEMQALKDKIAISQEEGAAKQAQLNELAKLEDAHSAAMAKLEGQRVLAVKKEWDGMLSGFTGAFEQSLNGMMQGTQTFQKAMANMGIAIQAEFLKMGVKRVTTWIANEAAMLMASKAKDKAIGGSGADAVTKAITGKATEAVAVVGSNAAEGAAGAAASQAAIPVVGPALALGAFATTMAMILGAKSLIHSSAGGEWQVPNDRLNLVHKNETILPAHIAGPLRDMVANGGSMGGGNTFHVNMIDTRGAKQFLNEHGSVLMQVLNTQVRNGNRMGKA